MSTATPPASGEAAPPAPPTPPPVDPPLGDGGQSALKAERERADKLEKELKKRDADLEKARIAALDENARAIEEAKAAVRSEVAGEYESKLLQARVQARAADFHDAALVAGLLALETGATDDDIDKALAALATEKPYLVKTPGAGGLPKMPQGPRGASTGGESADDWLATAVNAKRFG